MQYGYARISTIDQNAALLLDALERAGCKKIFKDEGISGSTANRPGLKRCLKSLQEGDRLTVWRLDRLGRSLRDLVEHIETFNQRGVQFRIGELAAIRAAAAENKALARTNVGLLLFARASSTLLLLTVCMHARS
jgi:DNA invertase Pin-like site-specific DNA recombinase